MLEVDSTLVQCWEVETSPRCQCWALGSPALGAEHPVPQARHPRVERSMGIERRAQLHARHRAGGQLLTTGTLTRNPAGHGSLPIGLQCFFLAKGVNSCSTCTGQPGPGSLQLLERFALSLLLVLCLQMVLPLGKAWMLMLCCCWSWCDTRYLW